MNGEKFNSDRAPRAVGLYPHARKVGDLLSVSYTHLRAHET